jgi:hypothetical protein
VIKLEEIGRAFDVILIQMAERHDRVALELGVLEIIAQELGQIGALI